MEKIQHITRKRFRELTAGFRWCPLATPTDLGDGWKLLGELESIGQKEKWVLAAKGALRRSQRVKKVKVGKYGSIVEFRMDDGSI